jgi:hypothetical protein
MQLNCHSESDRTVLPMHVSIYKLRASDKMKKNDKGAYHCLDYQTSNCETKAADK